VNGATIAIDTVALGRRYGQRWALRDATFSVPSGRVVGLVGANGSGKTTLLHMMVGLLQPSHGAIDVLGARPAINVDQLGRVSFVAQDAPVYPRLSVDEHLTLGARLNPRWDKARARARIERLDLDPNQKAGSLSGGQRAQLALALAIGKRPELLVLDEPVASLDPLARHEFMQALMELVADGLTIILSSHLLSDIERVCDHLVLLAAGNLQLHGDVDRLLSEHKVLTGPRRDTAKLPADTQVVSEKHSERQSTFLIRTTRQVLDPFWSVSDVGLEELVLAYMIASTSERERSPDKRNRLKVSAE
jgi:ABC-2 type transport system ATP-binding protein